MNRSSLALPLAAIVAACSLSGPPTPKPLPTRTPEPVRLVLETPPPPRPALGETFAGVPTPSALAEVIAGGGHPTDVGDGGPATAAELLKPIGLGLAPDGTLYVAQCDPNAVTAVANRVRRIATDGVIDTISGGVNPGPGFSGDGGPAAVAQLNCPFAVAADDDGNVYIADIFNHRVRMIDATGVITTIAGTGERLDIGDDGPASEASLNLPGEVLVTADGALLIASGPYIRRLASDGTITVIAGRGSPPGAQPGGRRWSDSYDGTHALTAAFSDSGGMAVSDNGDLYFADFGDNRVMMIDGTGLIHSVAGDGTSPTNADDDGDSGPATDAKLRSPADVALGPDGSLYILEHYGYIRRVMDGKITTVDIGWDYDQAQSIVADDQFLYIADREGAVVLRYPFER